MTCLIIRTVISKTGIMAETRRIQTSRHVLYTGASTRTFPGRPRDVRGDAGPSAQGLYFDEKQQRAANFYIRDSREAAESFFTEELQGRVTGLYGVAPSIEFAEIAEIAGNSRS
jgi:hypothetical protein